MIAMTARALELSKSVSLSEVAPTALDELRRTGRCRFDLVEDIFDGDHPGHYYRRTKSVSVSIQSVAGLHTRIAGTLTLIRSAIRTASDILDGADGYRRRTKDRVVVRDTRFQDIQDPIAASIGSDLPFEGAGVIGRWSLELSEKGVPGFDYGTIADVILHIHYTARNGGQELRTAVVSHLASAGTSDPLPDDC